MNDQQIEELVRRTGSAARELADSLDLHGCGQELLEEIMSTPNPTHATRSDNTVQTMGTENLIRPETQGTQLEPGPGSPHPHRRGRLPIAIAAAAAVIVAIAGPTLAFHYGHRAGPASTGTGRPTPSASSSPGPVALTPNPWLLPSGQDWKITYVDEWADNGEIRFEAGTRFLQVDWYRSSLYKGSYQDRSHVAKPVRQQVLGVEGALFPYGGGLFHLLLPPQGKVFLEISGQARDQAAFVATLGSLSKVSPGQWYAAMPASVVTPSQKPAVSAKMLADVPIPPGFDQSKLLTVGATIYYNYVEDVTNQAGCGWLSDYQQARKAHDAKDTATAAQALGTSRHWKVLQALNAQGSYSGVLWDYADRAVKGKSVSGYQKALDCR